MVRIQKYAEKGKGEKQDQANTQPVGTTMSCKAPLASSKALSTDVIPTSRLSRSMLSTAASRVKSVNTGSYGFVHRSRGSPRLGKSLPTDVRARDLNWSSFDLVTL